MTEFIGDGQKDYEDVTWRDYIRIRSPHLPFA